MAAVLIGPHHRNNNNNPTVNPHFPILKTRHFVLLGQIVAVYFEKHINTACIQWGNADILNIDCTVTFSNH
jgi:hypothetical protein